MDSDYEEGKNFVPDPKFLKKCPACGWIGVTAMRGCFRKLDHGSVGGGSVLLIDIRNDHG